LGSSGGSAPGPLLALVASETLRHGVAAGIRVALALALGRARHVLRSGGYIYLIRGLGLLLLAYALWFLCEGGRLLLLLARTAE
jgi:threonine/homoserine/homoserine lactone efflux protein